MTELEKGLVDAWAQAVGPIIAKHTYPKSFVDGCLFVVVPSALWGEQLGGMRWQIAERLNALLGEDETVEFLEFVEESTAQGL